MQDVIEGLGVERDERAGAAPVEDGGRALGRVCLHGREAEED